MASEKQAGILRLSPGRDGPKWMVMNNRMFSQARLLPSPREQRPTPARSVLALSGLMMLAGFLLGSQPLAAAAQTQQHQTQTPAAKPAPAVKTEPAKPDASKQDPAKAAADSAAGAGAAAPAGAPAAEGTSGLPLPRFVSLRSDQVNMRAGPGARYPVDWVYMRRDLPVEVIQEYETWRKIRDPDGAEGWVHQSMLTGRRTIMVRKDKAMLRRTADDTASAAAYLSQGVIGKLLQCPKGSDYCRVEVEGYQGWLRRNELWGAYKAEAIN